MVVAASGGYGAAYRGRYLIGEDGGRFVDRTKEMGLPETGAATMVMDLTGDGAPEVLIVGKGTGGVYVNDGKGRFKRVEGELTKFLQKRGPYLLRAFRADLDNDGDWDLVMSNPRYGREEIHENKGGGRFRKILAVGGWDSNPVVTCDINNDGRMDVVIGGAGKQEITVYLNETPHAGKHADIHPRMAAPNPYAVGAVVEAYWAGDLGRKGAVPIVTEKAHWDATPVHVGLGEEAKFDLRVKFPDGTVVEKRGVDSGKRWKVTPDGPLEDMDGGGRGGEASPHRGSVDR